MNNNYHDLIDRKEIENSVIWFNNHSNSPSEFKGKTTDEAIEYWKAKAVKTDEIGNILKLYEENSDLLSSDEDFVIVRELLTHPERDRLRLIHDGSYYTHRIWFNINNDGLVEVRPSICWKDSEFKRMSKHLDAKSPREKVDFLFKNFEVVYVQTPNYETREDIESAIRWKSLELKYDYIGWEDID